LSNPDARNIRDQEKKTEIITKEERGREERHEGLSP
jgi:hypothetical protein